MSGRLSQRQPKACTECTKKKRKCDIQSPCRRCVNLGLKCEREQVRIRRVVKQHNELDFLRNIVKHNTGAQLSHAEIIDALTERIHHLDGASEGVSITRRDSGSAPPIDVHHYNQPLEVESSLLMTLEHMTWGRNLHGEYIRQHLLPAGTYTRQQLEPVVQTHSLALPSTELARQLIILHLHRIAWHHNCLHGPSFLEQCEQFWSLGTYEEPQWMALYLAVLSTTAFCVSTNATLAAGMSTLVDTTDAAHMFDKMINVLYSENFLENISILSVQAIVISTEVAHNIGRSQINASLIGSAIRIAICLGLHQVPQVGGEMVAIGMPGLVALELGRRVWCQLLIQDYFAVPFHETYGVHPAHYLTPLLTNCNDDLVERDDDVLTISTYCRVLVQFANMMPGLVDGFGPVRSAKSKAQQYRHILDFDKQMREAVPKIIPAVLFRSAKTSDPAHAAWLSVAQSSLAITIADKIIMVHRRFLFPAFETQQYPHSRKTCVAAAMTILKEHELITRQGDISIWTHTAFCITSAMILCLEILHCLRYTELSTASYHDQVVAARERLATRNGDKLAARGVILIDVILQQISSVLLSSSDTAVMTIDVRDMMNQFFAASQRNETAVDDTFDGPLELTAITIDIADDMMDFTEWYNSLFDSPIEELGLDSF